MIKWDLTQLKQCNVIIDRSLQCICFNVVVSIELSIVCNIKIVLNFDLRKVVYIDLYNLKSRSNNNLFE